MKQFIFLGCLFLVSSMVLPMQTDNILVRRHVMRFEQQIEGGNGRRMSHFLETGFQLDDEGNYQPIHAEYDSTSIKSIIRRNFLASSVAWMGMALVIGSVITETIKPTERVAPLWYNQTTCPLYYCPNHQQSVLDLAKAGAFQIGSTFCLVKCIEAVDQCCGCCSELD